MADGFAAEIAPSSWKFCRPGRRMCTVAACVGGRAVSGRRKTTRWFIVEGDGSVKTNCVVETAWRLVWTGRPATMQPNIVEFRKTCVWRGDRGEGGLNRGLFVGDGWWLGVGY